MILAIFHNFQSQKVTLLLASHVTDDFKQLRSGLNFLGKWKPPTNNWYLISHIIQVMSSKQTKVFPLYILDYSLGNHHVYSKKLQRILLYLCTYLCWKKLADKCPSKKWGKNCVQLTAWVCWTKKNLQKNCCSTSKWLITCTTYIKASLLNVKNFP